MNIRSSRSDALEAEESSSRGPQHNGTTAAEERCQVGSGSSGGGKRGAPAAAPAETRRKWQQTGANWQPISSSTDDATNTEAHPGEASPSITRGASGNYQTGESTRDEQMGTTDHGGGVWELFFPGEPRTTAAAVGGSSSDQDRQAAMHKPGLSQADGRVQPPMGAEAQCMGAARGNNEQPRQPAAPSHNGLVGSTSEEAPKGSSAKRQRTGETRMQASVLVTKGSNGMKAQRAVESGNDTVRSSSSNSDSKSTIACLTAGTSGALTVEDDSTMRPPRWPEGNLAAAASTNSRKRLAEAAQRQRDEQAAKRRGAVCIPLHAIVTEHRLDVDEPKSATADPDELVTCDPDTAWWNEVEVAMEADRVADDQWCREVEMQMIIAREPEARISRGKRDPGTFQCTAVAKRPRRPG